MAKNTIVYYTKEGNISSGVVTTSTTVTLFTAGAEGSKVTALNVYSSSASGAFQLRIDGAIVYTFTGVPNLTDFLVEINAPVDCNSRRYLNLPAGAIIEGIMNNVGGATISVYVYGEDY